MSDAIVIPSQIRAARAYLGWSTPQLSVASGVSVRTIKYYEHSEHIVKVETLSKLSGALQAAGIEFIGTPDDNPGIRWRGRP